MLQITPLTIVSILAEATKMNYKSAHCDTEAGRLILAV